MAQQTGTRRRNEAVVTLGTDRRVLGPSKTLVFGRSSADGVVGLDPEDGGISRKAGRIERQRGSWIVTNVSSKRPLYVEHADVVRHARVLPSAFHELRGASAILVSGDVYTHPVRVLVPGWSPPLAPPLDEGSLTFEQPLSPDEFVALVALAEGYLRRWPRHDPNPKSHGEIAIRLGLERSPVTKRLENLRKRLGVDGNRSLVDWAIDSGRLRIEHLALLSTRDGAT